MAFDIRHDHGSLVHVVRACHNDDGYDLIAIGGEHTVEVLLISEYTATPLATFQIGCRITALAWSSRTLSPSQSDQWLIELAAATSDFGLHLLTKTHDAAEDVFPFGGGLSGHHGTINDMTFCAAAARPTARSTSRPSPTTRCSWYGTCTPHSTSLPFAEFSHNIKIHSATRKTPFELLHGFHPRFQPKIHLNPAIPTAEQRLMMMQKAQDEAKASQTLAMEDMCRQEDKYGKNGPTFKEGDKVWLDGKNLRLQYPKAKFGLKRQGPFQILQVISPINYKLKLPRTWKIHPVFHAGLLTPYHETLEHGPNLMPSPPDIIDGEQEWEVESVVKSRVYGKNR
ncbi:hypothetical protein EWM64_g9610 [Hericium alpestre]|uniref:Tf2-1-like SH3-like domain-containing protein n=1 Tax=Hericium alpestre TaxID=135208 RepID=A0A4Y9ZIX3_9AGAM|nr:hypothetical protein EWM64_g9610 [Hericium alpestre]